MYVNMHNVCARIQYSENNPDTVSVYNTLLHTRKHALFQTWERKGTSTMLILSFISYFELAVSVNFLALT